MHRSFAKMPPQIISYKEEAAPLRPGVCSVIKPPLFQQHHELFHLDVEGCVSNLRKHTGCSQGHTTANPAQHTPTLFFMAGGRTLMCTDKWTEWSNGGLLFPHFMGL